MAAKVSPAIEARVLELHRQHRTERDIARAVGLTPGGVHRVLQRLGHAPPRAGAKAPSPGPAPKASPAPPTSKLAPGPSPTTLDELRSTLTRTAGSLEELLEVAKAGGDLGGFASISRVLNATVLAIQRLQPPEPIDHEASPDMVAAAARAREKLAGLLDRALA